MKLYQKSWLLYLCMFLIPPVGIIMLWIIHKDMDKKRKVILTVISCIWTIIALVYGGRIQQTSSETSTTQFAVETESSGKEEKIEEEGSKV